MTVAKPTEGQREAVRILREYYPDCGRDDFAFVESRGCVVGIVTGPVVQVQVAKALGFTVRGDSFEGTVKDLYLAIREAFTAAEVKLNLHCTANGSGLGVSVPVTLIAVRQRVHGERHTHRSVAVRFPSGEVDEFQVRDLTFENYDQFDPEKL